MQGGELRISPVGSKQALDDFIDLPYRLYADDPNWVPPLRADVAELLNPEKNPFYGHAEGQLFLARRAGRVVGRISAHIDKLALAQPVEQGMGPGTGNWGMLDAEDEATAKALIATAEDWLKSRGMTRVLGPLSLSVWDEPGVLVKGFDHPPTVMMGHAKPEYHQWIESSGYQTVQELFTYALVIDRDFPELTNRIVAIGEKNDRIKIRRVDKRKFNDEAALILGILNDAWSDNWGFVPLTEAEIAYVGKKLKPIVYEDLIRIAEVDGEPVAFMMTLPDINEKIKSFGGKLFPFNWAKLLWWLRKPQVRTMRVPLMGVVKKLQASRMASQLAFMMIEYIRRDAITKFGASRGEFGWVLGSNGPMRSVGEAVGGTVNKVYRIYEKTL
ncbi:MAG: N-acetyltransferase [Sphingomonadales bacterium]|jgi:GNAT superfamily N-acetyltransferase|uniref:N-acetyltransferase n=1 Tax=Sphingorhabdus sp. TaxID=1902408 RepID=UPI003BB0CC6C|nr:N-acetyltransferase [Sphingomonadales bacterium]MBK9432283.1 N-acetyltransferase [Sphingomonadales bacterium]MBL0022182.1 N-acetyltransferase [Sphingomonadales bacterium]